MAMVRGQRRETEATEVTGAKIVKKVGDWLREVAQLACLHRAGLTSLISLVVLFKTRIPVVKSLS